MTDLDTRLAEIDEKLREIQDELEPDGELRPVADIDRLTALHASLLGSIREFIAALPPAAAAPLAHDPAVHAPLAHDPAAHAPSEVTLSAGPFSTVQSLRAFERELAALPGVAKVAVRGYEGEDRALIDVQLS